MKKQLFIFITLLLLTQSHEIQCGKAGVGIGAGLAGFAVGSAVASSNRRYSEPQYVERQVIVREQPQASSPDRGTIRRLENIIDDLRDENAELKNEIRDYKNDLRQLKNLKKENKELKESNYNLKKELEAGHKESVRDTAKTGSSAPAA